MERWLAGAPFPVPDPAQLREAFSWSEHRIVRKDATLSLFGVLYQVSDLSLAGRKAECVFDPFDMSVLEVRWNGRPHGTAVPQETGRHCHPKARPEQPGTPPPATGIDYLALIRAEHEQAERRRIRYDALGEGGTRSDRRPRTRAVSAILAWAARLRRKPASGTAGRRLPHRQGRRPRAHRRRARARGWSQDTRAAREASRPPEAADTAALGRRVASSAWRTDR
jgi:putative transposase